VEFSDRTLRLALLKIRDRAQNAKLIQIIGLADRQFRRG
jgi:hypothetical protein